MAACKCDLPKERIQVSSEKARLFASRLGIPYMRWSCASPNSAADVFSRISEVLQKNLQTYESLLAKMKHTNSSRRTDVPETQEFFSCLMCDDSSRRAAAGLQLQSTDKNVQFKWNKRKGPKAKSAKTILPEEEDDRKLVSRESSDSNDSKYYRDSNFVGSDQCTMQESVYI